MGSAGVFAVFFLAWQTIISLGLVQPYVLSSPGAVISRGRELFLSGEIWPHIAASGEAFLLGLLFSVVIGVPIGMLVGGTRIGGMFEPFLMAWYAVPMIAILPLIIIWFGVGILSKVVMITMGGIFPMLINTMQGVRDTDPSLLQMAKVFHAPKWAVMLSVRLPYSLVHILAGVRICIGRSLIFVVVAEFYAANKGLGYLIVTAGSQYDTATVLVAVAILATSGVVLTSLVKRAEGRLMRHRGVA